MAKLIDKVLDTARVYVERHQGVPATADAWIARRTEGRHCIVISVMVTTKQGYEAFDIWVTVDLDTEEIVVQE